MKLFKPKAEPKAPDVLVAATNIESVRQFLRVHRHDPARDARAWDWYDRIGEVHFGISSGARETSRSILKAIRWQDTMTFEDVDTGPVADLVSAIQSQHGGQAGLISSFYSNRKVTGDGYFFGYPQKEDPTRLWFDFCSTDEVGADQTRGNGRGEKIHRQRRPIEFGQQQDEEPELYNIDDIILARIWQPHPHFSDLADSPLKALDVVCDELDILTRALKAKITSRLTTAGFLLFPASATTQFVPPPSPSPNPDKKSENPFVDWVLQTMTRAIIDPSAPDSVMPFILVVPDEAVGLVRWITTEAETFEVEIKQRAELIARLLAGLDLRPEQIDGFGDSNHWSAWSSQDVHLKVDIAPEMEALSWALTTSYLWPQLRALRDAEELDSRFNWTEDLIRQHWVWYDLRELTVRPNKADSYGQVIDRGGLKLSSLRAAVGATDEDEPPADEYIRQFGWKHGDAYLSTFGLPEQEEIDWEKVSAKTGPGPDPASPGEDSPEGPDTKQPGGPGDNRGDRPRSQQPQ